MSDFAKRHYEQIAEVFQLLNAKAATFGECGYGKGICDAENALANLFRRDNYAFQEQRFHRACVPGANVRARS